MYVPVSVNKDRERERGRKNEGMWDNNEERDEEEYFLHIPLRR
jgi:hypothetical protein